MAILAIAAVIASALNGIVFWARRIGIYEPMLRQEYFARADAMEYSMDPSLSWLALKRFGASLYDTEGWLWWATKFPKELVWLALGCLLLCGLRRARLGRAMGAAYAGVFGVLGVSAIVAITAQLWLALAAGMRGCMAWVAGAAGTTLVDDAALRSFGRSFAWLLVLQGLLVPWELWRGSIMYWSDFLGSSLPRPVGTFNLPVSLGAFAVCAWALAYAWAGFPRRTMALLGMLVALVLLVVASASAWVGWALAALAIVHARLGLRARIGILLASLPLMIGLWLALPAITGRSNIQDSLWGRIEPIQAYAGNHMTPLELAFGLHFGTGSNALAALSGAETIKPPGDQGPAGDSMLAALLWQAGIVGTVLAYLLMLLAMVRDPVGRPLGVAMLVSSLVLNLPELFPLNLLLGLWLARAARSGRDG